MAICLIKLIKIKQPPSFLNLKDKSLNKPHHNHFHGLVVRLIPFPTLSEVHTPSHELIASTLLCVYIFDKGGSLFTCI
jgi:hypothetical protein